jgi:outer membrane protein assembly factor BamB
MNQALRVLVAVFFLAGVAAADDWPQWLGPTRDNATALKVVPWKDAPKILWKGPVGEGHSSPVIAGGRVFLHARVREKDEEEVTAWDAASGRELWRESYPRGEFKSMFGGGPRATPLVDGDRLYTNGVTGILTCWEASTGKRLWRVDTLKEFKAPNLFFGVSCSPLLEGNLLLLNVGGPGASVVAFRKETGEVAWKALDDKASYSSAIATGQGKERQVVFLTHQGLVGLSPQDGSLFWRFDLVDKLSESSTTPVLAGDLLIGSSVTYGSVCMKLDSREGKPNVTEVWKNPALTCYISSPLVVGKDQLYLVSGSLKKPPSATLRSVELKTGRELWKKEDVGRFHATLVRTGDGKLLMLGDGGELSLLDPDPGECKELARSKICGFTWAHPAFTGKAMVVRDGESILCLALGE